MTAIRQYFLEKVGQRISLTDVVSMSSKSGIYMNDPEQTAFGREIEYQRIESQYMPVQSYWEKIRIEAKVTFGSHEEYRRLADFIAQDEPMQLIYIPEDSETEFNLKCAFRRFTFDRNSESIKKGIIEIDGLGNWTKKSIYRLTNTETTGTKQYPHDYPYTYGESNINTINIYNPSKIPAQFKLSIIGKITNPNWRLYSCNCLIGEGQCNVSTQGNIDRFIVDTTTGNSMQVQTDVATMNVYQLSDFSTKRFFNIPYGNSYMIINTESGQPVNAVMEVYEQYATV
jgi:hypothetical protein